MYGILIREGIGRGPLKNIGDYIQSIAQRQFIKDKKTCYVDIEFLSDFQSKENVNVIMNGWFTWNCKKFLPPQCINPLFISFHLTPPAAKDFFTPEVIAYLKKYEPIGARDMLTAELMKERGIDSYFSGCMTMTLGKDYRVDRHDGDIFIVDPYIEFGGDKSKNIIVKTFRTIKFCFKHHKKALLLYDRFANQHMMQRFAYRVSSRLEHYIECATFYELYSKRFSDDILLNAKYISALVDNYMTNEEKFELADKMLKDYAKAKFVLTSRLHVAFPCLALGTKNIFVIPSLKTEEKDVKRYSGRLAGLDDTVTVMELSDGKIYNKNTDLPSMMTLENIPENKPGYRKYEEFLTEKVMEFIRRNE